MRNLIINLCYWIINKLQIVDEWQTYGYNEMDDKYFIVTKSGKVLSSKDQITWLPDKWPIVIICLLFACFIGCSSAHKHCGTAHYSEMDSQDFQNIKQNMQTEYFLINERGLR